MNLTGRTASGLLAREGRDVFSVCSMKLDVGNVVSDSVGMKDTWRKYMKNIFNLEYDWDGEVNCPEVMGHCCLTSEEEVTSAIKNWKSSWSYWCSE